MKLNLTVSKIDGSDIDSLLKENLANLLDYEKLSRNVLYLYEDIKELSKQYPDVLFRLTGQNELDTVKWRSFYNSGKRQQIIEFEQNTNEDRHDNQILKLSEESPDVIFSLVIKNPSIEDVSPRYFINGKMQKLVEILNSEIVYRPFEPEKLI